MTAVAAPPGPAPEPVDVRGPSAFDRDVRRTARLAWIIAWTDFRLTYFGSVLGPLWTFMRPLLTFGVLYVVFSQIVRFGEEVEHYAAVLLLNIVLFTFFQDAVTRSVTAVHAREPLVRKMHFPRVVIPLSTVLTAGLFLVQNLVAVLVLILAFGVTPTVTWLLLPVPVLGLVALASGLAMLVSSLYVRFRDVQPIWTVVATVLFYGSPVLYVLEAVPESVRSVVALSPIATMLELGRKWVIDPDAPGPAAGSGWLLLIPAGITVGILLLGLWVLRREAPRIAERL